MRNSLLAAACLLLLGVSLAEPDAETAADEGNVVETGKIIVNVEGFQSNDGTARVLLFDSANRYPTRPLRREMRPIRQRRARFEIDNVPFGVYGVAVYRELMGDARPFDFHMNTPYRPVAFSNNARIGRGERGPPSFDAISFSLNQAELEMSLELLPSTWR